MTIKKFCKKHPRYKAMRYPTSGCAACLRAFLKRAVRRGNR